MLTLTISPPNVKAFMSRLFKESAFDAFEIRELVITSFVRFEITSPRAFVLWQDVKPFAFNFIKGGKKPDMIKIVFAAASDLREALHRDARALFLNIVFDADILRVTTAVSQKEFSLDKDLDKKWESYAEDFFKDLGLPFEII